MARFPKWRSFGGIDHRSQQRWNIKTASKRTLAPGRMTPLCLGTPLLLWLVCVAVLMKWSPTRCTKISQRMGWLHFVSFVLGENVHETSWNRANDISWYPNGSRVWIWLPSFFGFSHLGIEACRLSAPLWRRFGKRTWNHLEPFGTYEIY